MIFQIAQSLFDVVGLVTVLDGGAKDFSEPVERILIHVVDPHQLLNGKVENGGVFGGGKVFGRCRPHVPLHVPHARDTIVTFT